MLKPILLWFKLNWEQTPAFYVFFHHIVSCWKTVFSTWANECCNLTDWCYTLFMRSDSWENKPILRPEQQGPIQFLFGWPDLFHILEVSDVCVWGGVIIRQWKPLKNMCCIKRNCLKEVCVWTQVVWICPIMEDISVHVPFLGILCCFFQLWRFNKHDNEAVSQSTSTGSSCRTEKISRNPPHCWGFALERAVRL